MCILAIDLGKSNSVACVYMMTDGAHRFRTVRTTLSEMEKLLDIHDEAVGCQQR